MVLFLFGKKNNKFCEKKNKKRIFYIKGSVILYL